jgi:16S rRNA (cytosine967-C5)-methyltransferase
MSWRSMRRTPASTVCAKTSHGRALRAEIVVGDALEHQGAYDAILLDAPCTATGTIRRHPDLPFVKSGRETEELTRLQMRLLDHALTLLNPGGRLVFCTCSLLAVEGEYQVKAALKRHEGLSVVPVDPVTLGGDPDWASPEGGLRLWPSMWADRGGIDGFYMACLTRWGRAQARMIRDRPTASLYPCVKTR